MSHVFELRDFYQFFIVFCRFAGLLSFFPGLADQHVPARIRLLFAVMLAAGLVGVLQPVLPQQPANLFDRNIMLGLEFILGIFAALIAKLLLSSLDIAGATIGYNMGMVNTFTESVASNQQSSAVASFLSWIGLILIFTTYFHHIIILMVVKSFYIFKPGVYLDPLNLSHDLMQLFLKFFQASFILGLQLSAPFIILNLLVLTVAGILNRIIPSIQVFYILQPVQIVLGLGILILTATVMFEYFTDQYESIYQHIWQFGE